MTRTEDEMECQVMRIERVRWCDPGFARARQLEYEIFGIANGFTTAEDVMAGEMIAYRDWERSSEFHVGYCRDQVSGGERAIAVIRFLRHDLELGADSFSTLRDFRRYRPDGGAQQNYLFPEWDAFFRSSDPAQIAELATQAVLPAYRGSGVIEQLWRNFIGLSAPDGVRIWTMALVEPLFRWYKALLPQALCAIGRMIPGYVGADSIPAMLRLDHPTVTAVIAAYDARPAGGLVGARSRTGTASILPPPPLPGRPVRVKEMAP